MKSILRDPKINYLARRCEAWARVVGIQRPAAAFIHAAVFAMKAEDRLCIGAVELELLEKREDLQMAVCKTRGIDLRTRHLDRLAREYGDGLTP